MKKYEFIKNGVDDYTLKFKDKEIKFNSNVDIATRLQNTVASAKIKMVKDLSKEGLSIKDLTIEKKENGKTYYDNTNKIEIEKTYTEQEQSKVFMEIIEELFGMNIQQLFVEIGLEEEKEAEEFSEELGEIITGNYNSPSDK